MENKTQYNVGIYCRLSKDDELRSESASIGTQRSLLTAHCISQGYAIYKVYVDDGFSGLNFDRPGFNELLADIDNGDINMVITKDLSRLGRDYIMTGYYSELFFPMHGVRYVALGDDFDSLKENNDIAPFKNILNDMYARDISRKVKIAKHHHAKEGRFIGSMAPYGYLKSPEKRGHLIPDPATAETVRLIYSLALQGMGIKSIANELQSRRILTPAALSCQRGEVRFANRHGVKESELYNWNYATVRNILTSRVYLGDMVSLKTECINCKTKQRVRVPKDEQIVTPGAHEALVSREDFERVQLMLAQRLCPAKQHRENIFRGLLYCSCCGHAMSIAHKKLKYTEDDIYRCTYHYRRPDVCPETHSIYHKALCDHVLSQIQSFSKSLKRRKLSLQLAEYCKIEELTPEILNAVIERIEIGHVGRKSKIGNVVRIYWRLK